MELLEQILKTFAKLTKFHVHEFCGLISSISFYTTQGHSSLQKELLLTPGPLWPLYVHATMAARGEGLHSPLTAGQYTVHVYAVHVYSVNIYSLQVYSVHVYSVHVYSVHMYAVLFVHA